MLIRSQEGVAYNVNIFKRIEVQKSAKDGEESTYKVIGTPPSDGRDATPFSSVAQSLSKVVLGAYLTQEEADDALREIVKSSGGVDLAPEAKTAQGKLPHSTSHRASSFSRGR